MYGGVVVLGPTISAAARPGVNSVGLSSATGTVASAPFRNVRRATFGETFSTGIPPRSLRPRSGVHRARPLDRAVTVTPVNCVFVDDASRFYDMGRPPRSPHRSDLVMTP